MASCELRFNRNHTAKRYAPLNTVNQAYFVGRGLPKGLIKVIDEYDSVLSYLGWDSRKNTRSTIERFAVWASDTIDSFHELSADLLIQWYFYCTSRKDLGPEGIYYSLNKVTNFVDFLIASKGYPSLSYNPLAELRMHHRPSRKHYGEKHVRTTEKIVTLHRILARNRSTEFDQRDLILFELLVKTPFRITEIIDLKSECFDFGRRVILCEAKEVSVTPELAELIENYLLTRRAYPNNQTTQYLLRSKTGARLCYGWVKAKTYSEWSFFASCKINSKVLKHYQKQKNHLV